MVGSRRWFTGPRYAMQSVTHFQSCVFSIKHRGIQYWRDLALGSGFDIEMIYTKKIQLDADAIGLDDEMDMTPTLAKFLYLNRHLVQERLEIVQEGLEEYRAHCRHEAELKQKTLSYEFLTQVYNWPLQHLEVIKAVEKSESDLRVRNLFAASQDSLDLATQRMQVTGRSEITVWWYLFWVRFIVCILDTQLTVFRMTFGEEIMIRSEACSNMRTILILTMQAPLHTVHFPGLQWKLF